jgi:uncharacterized membrane protein
MVVMVLDHTRDFFTDSSIDATDLSQSTPALFLTRWVTHFCAPTFALLAGVGVRLAARRGHDPAQLSRFLLTRGLWLIFLEQTVEKAGLLFQIRLSPLLGIVLWSIGGSFVLLSLFVVARMPAWVVGAVGLAIIACHNLLDLVPQDAAASIGPLLVGLLRPGPIPLPAGLSAFVLYPLLPWFGVVAAGYWVGGVYGLESRRRRSMLTTLGWAAIALFVALRASGMYGDPRRWSTFSDGLTTVLSFVNCTKYPPSLQFLLMTLGPALLALAAVDAGVGKLGKPFVTLGRVPLFFYLLQWYVIHGLALLVAIARGEPTDWLFIDGFPIEPPPSSVFGLPATYAFWLLVLACLYLPCAWFANFKQRHRDWVWVSYL